MGWPTIGAWATQRYAACAASFIGRGDYRSPVAMVTGQAVGAAAGMTVGSLVPDTAPWVIAAATAVGGTSRTDTPSRHTAAPAMPVGFALEGNRQRRSAVGRPSTSLSSLDMFAPHPSQPRS